MIEFSNINVSFKHGKQTQQVLHNLSFSVEQGKTIGFIGPNGSGKTTTLHVLLGFITPDSGTATLLNTDVRTAEARKRIGYLSEHPECYKFMTGYEYLNMMARIFRIPKSLRTEKINQLLSDVELSDHAHKRIATYSRGMLQRIGLAQALINDPELLILDEPTNGLDPLGRMKIRKLIEARKAQGKTIFFSSHELSEIETVCDEIIMIQGGRIVKQGTVAELTENKPNLEYVFLETLQSTHSEQ